MFERERERRIQQEIWGFFLFSSRPEQEGGRQIGGLPLICIEVRTTTDAYFEAILVIFGKLIETATPPHHKIRIGPYENGTKAEGPVMMGTAGGPYEDGGSFVEHKCMPTWKA